MKLLVLSVILLLSHGGWSSKEKKTSIWPKNKVLLSESYLPAVAQVLTHLLDLLDQVDVVEGPEVVQLVLLSPPTPSNASTAVSILNATDAEGGTSTVKTVVVGGEEVLKERIPGLKPSSLPSKPSLVEVALGRLRDVLVIEAKRQGFQKIQGYSQKVLDTLKQSSLGKSEEQLRMLNNNQVKRRDSLAQGYSRKVLDTLKQSSLGTSEEQLRMLIELMLKNNHVKRRDSLAQATLVLEGLNAKDGPLQRALANIPPFKVTS